MGASLRMDTVDERLQVGLPGTLRTLRLLLEENGPLERYPRDIVLVRFRLLRRGLAVSDLDSTVPAADAEEANVLGLRAGRHLCPRMGAVPLLRHYVISQVLFSGVCAAGIVVFGTGIAATPHPAPRMEEVVPAQQRQRLSVLGQLVCLYYLVLFVWEIAFVSALK